MLRQVEDLLQFAALEAGGVRLEREPLELGELVRGLMDAAAPTAQARGLTLQSELRGTPAWVEGDATRLIQVCRNLLDNALKFTDHGHVQVRLAVQPIEPQRDLCRIQFEVEDTGSGIRAEDTRRLLAPFQQGDGAITRRHGGVGLGLAIAQRLVRHMGGQLELQSALGKGTRVSIHMQLPAAAPRSKPATLTPQVASGGRALIVDDSAPARELLRAMLELAGWHVREAESGDVARALAAQETPDLILLDYQMPGADGAETALALRKLCEAHDPTRQVAIYLLTANLFAHEQLGELVGLHGVLAKPLSRAALMQLLNATSEGQRKQPAQPAEPTAHHSPEALQHLRAEVIADLRELRGRDGRTHAGPGLGTGEAGSAARASCTRRRHRTGRLEEHGHRRPCRRRTSRHRGRPARGRRGPRASGACGRWFARARTGAQRAPRPAGGLARGRSRGQLDH